MTGEMNGKYVVRGNNAECYVEIGEKRYNFAQAISLEANVEISKAQGSAIGRSGKFNFATSWSGSGSMTLHYNQSIMRQMLYDYKKTGNEIYFDIAVINKSNNDVLGDQVVWLKDCSIDGGVLTKFDSDAEYLDEEVSFTFDDFEIPEKFSDLPFINVASDADVGNFF